MEYLGDFFIISCLLQLMATQKDYFGLLEPLKALWKDRSSFGGSGWSWRRCEMKMATSFSLGRAQVKDFLQYRSYARSVHVLLCLQIIFPQSVPTLQVALCDMIVDGDEEFRN